MSEAELNRMVEELNGARLGLQRLTTWRRFQLSVEIETPSMIARFAQRINERTLPPSYVPSDPQQARELLLPSVTSNDWRHGDSLPIPSRLLADMTEQAAMEVCEILALGPPLPQAQSLSVLEHIYFQANLSYVVTWEVDECKDLLFFAATMDEIPTDSRGSATLLLLYLSRCALHIGHPPEQMRPETPVTTARQAAELRDRLDQLFEDLLYLPRSMTRLMPTVKHLDLLPRLGQLRREVDALQKRHANAHLVLSSRSKNPRADSRTRRQDYSLTERQALLALERVLLPLVGTQIDVAAYLVEWLTLLGPWRGGVDPVDSLRRRLRTWAK